MKNKIEESGTNYTFLWLSGRQFGNQHFWVMAQTAYNKQEFTLVPFTFENWMPGEPVSSLICSVMVDGYWTFI